MFQITRRRLAFWYTSLTAILLLLFATGVYLYVRNTLIERVDDTLNHVVEVVERSLTIKSTEDPQFPYEVDIKASFRNNNKTIEDDHIDLEWFNPQGKLLWSTFTEPLEIPLNPDYHETVPVSLQDILPSYFLRQVTSKFKVEDYFLGYLRVSHPWFEVTKPSRDLIIDLGFGTTLMIIAVAGIGWFLSGLAIQPVRDSYQSLKQFTSDASHELRNPIAIIQTNVQLALADPDLDPKLPEQQRLITSLQVVERLSKRLGKLVDDLLFLARSDSGIVQIEKQIVHIDSLLIQVVEEQQLVADQRQIELSLDFQESAQEEDFAILGDENQIARLFTNIVSNAISYTSSLGRVDIVLSRITKSKENWLGIKQNLTQNLAQNLTKSNHFMIPLLQVTIKDTGIGIPPLELERIFDRFYRVDTARSHQGNSSSGLGLAIARTIIQNHQGEITVTSVPNQGTTFMITLPSINLPSIN